MQKVQDNAKNLASRKMFIASRKSLQNCEQGVSSRDSGAHAAHFCSHRQFLRPGDNCHTFWHIFLNFTCKKIKFENKITSI